MQLGIEPNETVCEIEGDLAAYSKGNWVSIFCSERALFRTDALPRRTQIARGPELQLELKLDGHRGIEIKSNGRASRVAQRKEF
jgi:hypothetical protein